MHMCLFTSLSWDFWCSFRGALRRCRFSHHLLLRLTRSQPVSCLFSSCSVGPDECLFFINFCITNLILIYWWLTASGIHFEFSDLSQQQKDVLWLMIPRDSISVDRMIPAQSPTLFLCHILSHLFLLMLLLLGQTQPLRLSASDCHRVKKHDRRHPPAHSPSIF